MYEVSVDRGDGDGDVVLPRKVSIPADGDVEPMLF